MSPYANSAKFPRILHCKKSCMQIVWLDNCGETSFLLLAIFFLQWIWSEPLSRFRYGFKFDAGRQIFSFTLDSPKGIKPRHFFNPWLLYLSSQRMLFITFLLSSEDVISRNSLNEKKVVVCVIIFRFLIDFFYCIHQKALSIPPSQLWIIIISRLCSEAH